MSGSAPEGENNPPEEPFDVNNYIYDMTTLINLNMIVGVRYQLSLGIDVNEKLDGQYPAKLAAETGHVEILKLFIEAGADVNMKCGYYEEPLVFSAKDLETLKVLVGAGANVNVRSADNTHLLHKAVRRKKLDIVEYLLESCGADVNATNLLHETPLHLACCSQYSYTRGFSLGIIKALVKNNARTDGFDSERNTPFMRLLWYRKQLDDKFLKIFKFMLKYTDVTDFYRTTDIAVSSNLCLANESLCKIYLRHVCILLSLGANVNSHEYFINRRADYHDFFAKCKNELMLASSMKLNYNSWLTFYHLLTDDYKKLKNYAGNQSLLNYFQSTNFISKFPIYGGQMQERVKKGIKIRKLYDQSCTLFSHYLPIFNPYHLIVRDVLNCVANSKDLSMFLGMKNQYSAEDWDMNFF